MGLALGLILLLPLVPGGTAELSGQVHQCSYCHDIHGGFTSADVALNREAAVEDVCMTCHGDGGPGYLVDGSTVNSAIDFTEGVHAGNLHAVNDTTSCWDCHDHEGEAGANLFMIPETLDLPGGGTASVVFTNNTTQADFTGTDGICYVCHTDPASQATGLSGHNGPDVCTTCHAHEGGFQATGGGCTSCHNKRQPDPDTGHHREVVSEFDRPSHHVQTGGAGADIPEEDCTTCHDQTGHPRSGSSHVVLLDPDGGTSISYDRGVTDPSVLTNFCIACHDNLGATRLGTPLVPFSDGQTRPEIDEAAWVASSHFGSGVSDCADCHESHGSELGTLFMPGDTPPDPTTLYEEEEGFCFNCHTGGGPASADIQSQFDDATINWVSNAWGDGQITTFNDRHDVTHAASSVSGAKIECVDCHRPHADNSAQKYNPDPDPDQPATTWAGSTAMDAFCVDCHDGTLPAGVLDHAGGPMADIALFYTTIEKHGPTPTSGEQLNGVVWIENTLGAGASDMSEVPNPYLTQNDAAGGYTHTCVQCHRPHPKATWPGAIRNDFFSLVDTVRAPDGRGMAYWEDISSMGNTTRTVFWDYGLSEDEPRVLGEDAYGGYYCNTCHDRRGMNGKDTCGSSGCHKHGGSTGM